MSNTANLGDNLLGRLDEEDQNEKDEINEEVEKAVNYAGDVAITLSKKVLQDEEFIALQAKYVKKLHSALIEEGFTHEDALILARPLK